MKMLKLNFVVHAPRLYLILLVFTALLFCSMLYYSGKDADSRLIGLISGLASGLMIAFLQFLTQYLEQKTLAEYKEHGLVKFLTNRKDAEYYRELIKNTKFGDKIMVVGVTCNRLLEDFANTQVSQSQDILEALARGVEVKLLLPKVKYLEEPNLSDFKNKTLQRSKEISNLYPGRFNLLYYDFEPSHSIFLAGSRCLVGPIFKNKSSRDTPTIAFDKDGLFIKPYLSYMEDILKNASDQYD